MCAGMRTFPPIFLFEPPGANVAVGDVVRAAEWLVEKWPPDFVGTPLHRAAQVSCLQALKNEADAIDARAALISAAEEAGIFEGDVPPITRRESGPRKRRR